MVRAMKVGAPINVVLASFLAAVSLSVSADQPSTPLSFFDDAEKEFSLRHRIENVRDTAFANDALASTFRTRIGLHRISSERGLQYQFQAEGVSDAGSTRYNTLATEDSDYPVIADPKFTEINQAWLGYQENYGHIRIGRQAINVLNQRFLGSDAFRQNEQTLDGVRIHLTNQSTFNVEVGVVNNVNRVIDPKNAGSDVESQVQYAAVSYGLARWASLASYGFLMDLGDDRSNNTFGLMLKGEAVFADTSIRYLVDWATQSAGDNHSGDYTSHYFHWQVGTRMGDGDIAIGTELMHANEGGEFQTPLASLHEFNGWADRFIDGAAGFGLKDIYFKYSKNFGEGIIAEINYHAYSSRSDELSNQLDYGDEWGWRLLKRFDSPTELEFGFVKYRAEDGGVGWLNDHVQRIWLGVSYQF